VVGPAAAAWPVTAAVGRPACAPEPQPASAPSPRTTAQATLAARRGVLVMPSRRSTPPPGCMRKAVPRPDAAAQPVPPSSRRRRRADRPGFQTPSGWAGPDVGRSSHAVVIISFLAGRDDSFEDAAVTLDVPLPAHSCVLPVWSEDLPLVGALYLREKIQVALQGILRALTNLAQLTGS